MLFKHQSVGLTSFVSLYHLEFQLIVDKLYDTIDNLQ